MPAWLLPAIAIGASALSQMAKAKQEKQQRKEDAENTAIQQYYSGYTRQAPVMNKSRALQGTMGGLANIIGSGVGTYSNWMDWEARQRLLNAQSDFLQRSQVGEGPGAPADDGTPAGPVARSGGSPWAMDASALGAASPRGDSMKVDRSAGVLPDGKYYNGVPAELSGPVNAGPLRQMPTNGNGWTELWGPEPGENLTEAQKLDLVNRGYDLSPWGY